MWSIDSYRIEDRMWREGRKNDVIKMFYWLSCFLHALYFNNEGIVSHEFFPVQIYFPKCEQLFGKGWSVVVEWTWTKCALEKRRRKKFKVFLFCDFVIIFLRSRRNLKTSSNFTTRSQIATQNFRSVYKITLIHDGNNVKPYF